MQNGIRITAIIGIILLLGSVLIAVQASQAAPSTSKDPTPPPLQTDGKNTTTGHASNDTVIKPSPLPPDTPSVCHKYQWSDSFKANIAGIATQSGTYQLSTAKTLCNNQGFTEAVAVMAFPADQYTPTDQLYYSCYKIITVTCS